MGKRVDLQNLFELTLGSENVYFQPPPTISMNYPCIVYSRDSDPYGTTFADDIPYSNIHRYKVTVIDPDPDSDIPDKIGAFPMCIPENTFTVDNLNHYVYNLYY